jgi:hypothetical protein
MPRQPKRTSRPQKNTAYSVELESSTPVDAVQGKSFQWNGNTQGLLGIANGSAGIIFALGDYYVVKVYLGRDSRRIENAETERQAYRNLQSRGPFAHVLSGYDIDNPYGLVLERCCKTVRQKIRSSDYSPCDEALSFAFQAAKGLTFIHGCGIRQGDGSTKLKSSTVFVLTSHSWLS